MPFLFSFLLKYSISLAVVYIFYQLVLRPLTFYQWNRFYLLGYTMLSIAIPFINIQAWVQQSGTAESRFISIIPALAQYPSTSPAQTVLAKGAEPAIDWYYWLAMALTAGTAIMLGRLVVLYLSLRRMKRNAVLLSDDDQLRLYGTEMPVSPFSFGRSVYFNTSRHTDEELEQIIRHEYVHVKQRHTIDLVAGELLCLFNWYNPFAWLMRYSMRQNLEFIADNKVIENGVDRKAYQYLLLKVVGVSHYRIANNFNFSNLKKRIAMMNKMKSARLHLTRFLFVLPLLAVLLVAFRGASGPNAKFFITSGIVMDIVTRQPLSGARVTETSSGVSVMTDTRGFFRMSIPVRTEKPSYHYVAAIDGYEQSAIGFTPGANNNGTGGNVEIMALRPLKGVLKGAYMMGYSGSVAGGDPNYEDALKLYKTYLVQLDGFELYAKLTGNNPQVQYFYTSEDKKKEIVFLKDGGIEKYGYPGTPSLGDMEKKYGRLPWMENQTDHSYYDKQWQDISEKLQKTFVQSGHAAKAILFPGDSRVLAQMPNGKVVIYDMDYDKERADFETTFGKLEGVPPPSRSDNVPFHTPAAVNGQAPAASATSPTAALSLKTEDHPVILMDASLATVRPDGNFSLDAGTAPQKVRLDGIHDTLRFGNPEPLLVIDGVVQENGFNVNAINPADIETISILKDFESTAKYGIAPGRSVVEIQLKTKQRKTVEAAIDSVPLKPGTISWNASAHRLSVRGTIYWADRNTAMSSDLIHMNPQEQRIAINGVLIDPDKDYTTTGYGSYRINSLDQTAAQKKYGTNSVKVLDITAQ